jgi:hypothetical protein
MWDTVTFVTSVYTVVDDLYRQYFAPIRAHTRGRRPQLSDSEVLTLLLLGHWYHLSERALLRRAQADWSALFPRLLHQSAFNRRGRGLERVLLALGQHVARDLGTESGAYEVLDGVAVPLARICRGKKRRLFHDAADIGKGGADKQWYYGVKLLLAVQASGVISGFVAGPASTEERVLAEALFAGRAQRDEEPQTGALPPQATRHVAKPSVGTNGPIWPRQGVGQTGSGRYLGDRGYRGTWWEQHWREDSGATVITPAAFAADNVRARRAHASLRQIVETVNGHLIARFGLTFPGARSLAGLRTRVAAKVACLNLGILLNRRAGRRDLALATLAA